MSPTLELSGTVRKGLVERAGFADSKPYWLGALAPHLKRLETGTQLVFDSSCVPVSAPLCPLDFGFVPASGVGGSFSLTRNSVWPREAAEGITNRQE